MDDLYRYLTDRMDRAFRTSASVHALLASAVYEPFDAIVRDAGTDLTCGPGCDDCCHRLVVCTRIEALALAEYLNEGGRLAPRARAIEDHAGALRQAIEGPASETQGHHWFERRVPCPFLADGRCAVYALRPLSCRAHHSTDDPRGCSEPLRHVGQNRTILDAHELFAAMIQRAAGLIDRRYGVRGLLSIALDEMLAAGLFGKTAGPDRESAEDS